MSDEKQEQPPRAPGPNDFPDPTHAAKSPPEGPPTTADHPIVDGAGQTSLAPPIEGNLSQDSPIAPESSPTNPSTDADPEPVAIEDAMDAPNLTPEDNGLDAALPVRIVDDEKDDA